MVVTVMLVLGGFAALAIALEGARSWSLWADRVLVGWGIGGAPAAPELFVYPVFFSMVIVLVRPLPSQPPAWFLLLGMFWSGTLFLADPAMRTAIHAATPSVADFATAAVGRGVLLYLLLCACVWRCWRRLMPFGDAPKVTLKSTGRKGNNTAAD